jgi:hypothetical protein
MSKGSDVQTGLFTGTTIALEQKTRDTVTAADLDQLRRDWTLEKTAAQGGRTGRIPLDCSSS